jgi:RimJ/RimL family protein N-acetyltransferase
MINGPLLVTQRLILRPPAPEDFDAWAAFHEDEDNMRHLGGVKSRSEAWQSLCSLAGAWHIRGFSMFSLVSRETGQWIGRVGPWQPEGWPGAEVGWGVAREFAGQGFACEAAVATIDYAFDLLGWDEVIHVIDPDNKGSIALAGRLGARNQGPTRLPKPLDKFRVDKYGQSKQEWQQSRKQFIA